MTTGDGTGHSDDGRRWIVRRELWLAATLACAALIAVEATTATATPSMSAGVSPVALVAPAAASAAPATAPAPRPSPTKSAPATPRPTPTPTPKPTPSAPTLPPGTRVPTAYPVHSGDGGPLVLHVQQRLAWMGYPVKLTAVMDSATVKAVKRFRSKFALGSSGVVSSSTWKKLTALTHANGLLPARCTSEAVVLCVDKTQRSLRLVRHGVVVLMADARFGGLATPTREGSFRIYRKSRDHVSSVFHTRMPFAMFFSGGEAVHYSPYFDRDGYNGASHGCVNLRDIGIARSLFDQIPLGTRVVVFRS
jgi:hypothetical protein